MMPKPTVTVNNWDTRVWRVCLYQPADTRDWNAMGRRLFGRFCRCEKAARALAKQLARDNSAQYPV
jgi:hypothetical protein